MNARRLRPSVLVIALVAGLVLSLHRPAMSQEQATFIIDNGTVQLGINPEGHLNVPGGTASMPDASTTFVGLRFVPTNGEATAAGCLCEGWGVANADEATGTFAGYANVSSDGGVQGLVV